MGQALQNLACITQVPSGGVLNFNTASLQALQTSLRERIFQQDALPAEFTENVQRRLTCLDQLRQQKEGAEKFRGRTYQAKSAFESEMGFREKYLAGWFGGNRALVHDFRDACVRASEAEAALTACETSITNEKAGLYGEIKAQILTFDKETGLVASDRSLDELVSAGTEYCEALDELVQNLQFCNSLYGARFLDESDSSLTAYQSCMSDALGAAKKAATKGAHFQEKASTFQKLGFRESDDADISQAPAVAMPELHWDLSDEDALPYDLQACLADAIRVMTQAEIFLGAFEDHRGDLEPFYQDLACYFMQKYFSREMYFRP